MARGFYSVVQYCPDRFRAEAVNVGLVLLCVDPRALRVKMTSNFDRVRRLFAMSEADLKNLKFSTQGLTSRIEQSADELRTSEDLAAFAASRANDLRLTEPRLAKLSDFDGDFARLFAELVEFGGRRPHPARPDGEGDGGLNAAAQIRPPSTPASSRSVDLIAAADRLRQRQHSALYQPDGT